MIELEIAEVSCRSFIMKKWMSGATKGDLDGKKHMKVAKSIYTVKSCILLGRLKFSLKDPVFARLIFSFI